MERELNMMKKSLAILLALFLLAMSLTGCGVGKLAQKVNEARNSQKQEANQPQQDQPQ